MRKRGVDALARFEKLVGHRVINDIKERVKRLEGKHVVFINSTYQGGGVAEMLNSIIPLFNMMGIKVGWRVLHGNNDFYRVTKQFHNGLQGENVSVSKEKISLYRQTNERFSLFSHFDHDLVIVHDPQPLPLIDFYPKVQPWIFRLHMDISSPDTQTWRHLSEYMKKYDHIIVSKEDYINPDLMVPHSIFNPCIDPFSTKNAPMTQKKVSEYLEKYDIDEDKPIISQISRFDKWKDPLGVIKVFEKVRKEINCQLVLLGSFATDDPEGQEVYDKVRRVVRESNFRHDINVILVNSDILVNAVQRASSVVIQKSIREGFGLTVAEALFKGTPVVASKVGGIPLQLIHGVNGYLHEPDDITGFSHSILKILHDEELAKSFSEAGIEHIENRFLVPQLMLNYLSLFESYLG